MLQYSEFNPAVKNPFGNTGCVSVSQHFSSIIQELISKRKWNDPTFDMYNC